MARTHAKNESQNGPFFAPQALLPSNEKEGKEPPASRKSFSNKLTAAEGWKPKGQHGRTGIRTNALTLVASRINEASMEWKFH